MHKETSSQENHCYNQQIWKAHVDAWRRSNLSIAEYCRRHNLSHHALRYWKKKNERADDAGVTLVPVPLPKTIHGHSLNRQASLKVEVGNRFKIEVGDDFTATTLIRLVKTLDNC